jgi:hypothetical protein
MGATASPSDADEPKSNKFNAFRAQPTLLTPAEVEDVLPPTDFNFHGSGFLCEAKPQGS